MGPMASSMPRRKAVAASDQFMADGSVTALKALLDGNYRNNPCALTVDAAGRIWFCDPFHPIRIFGPALFPPLRHGSILRLHRDDRRELGR